MSKKLTEDEIRDLFFDANINYDEITYVDDYMCILVRGDWKHTHLYCDYLVRKYLRYTLMSTKIVESDGSDWYTAKRYYKKICK